MYVSILNSARDANQFTVSVNIEPQAKMLFNLTYEELLTRRQGIYEQVIVFSYFLWCSNIIKINMLGYSRQSGNGCPSNECESQHF